MAYAVRFTSSIAGPTMMENSLVNMHAVPHTPVADMPLACRAVAIGASAGGIRALQIVLAALPPDFSAPILIVLHLEPRHDSLLPRVLGARTMLRVKAAEPGEPLVRCPVYLAVPDLHLLAVQDCVALASTTEVHYSRPSVDALFNSIAASYGGAACGVLSGAGRDGAQGLAAIKAAGGMTIVQDPATADHRGMPLAAVATKSVDMILPVDAIAPALIRRAMAPNADGACRDARGAPRRRGCPRARGSRGRDGQPAHLVGRLLDGRRAVLAGDATRRACAAGAAERREDLRHGCRRRCAHDGAAGALPAGTAEGSARGLHRPVLRARRARVSVSARPAAALRLRPAQSRRRSAAGARRPARLSQRAHLLQDGPPGAPAPALPLCDP